ncbi:MAG: ThiF family adenylyltransferase [Candidatus Thiodiazotropha lotti]|nr:ThiF family adenylyltransferase [Candidatus Thiodiazotropha lotti]
MLNTALAEVHRWLSNEGFSRIHGEARWYAYDGILVCNKLEVPVRLRFENLDFTDLPEIYLLDPRPEKLQRPLSHVDTEGKLCYLDAEAHFLDRYQPVKSVATLLELARNVLVDSLRDKNSGDVGYEFSAYWDWSVLGVSLSTPSSGSVVSFNYLAYSSPTGNDHKQIVVGTKEEIKKYADWKNGTLCNMSDHTAIWIRMTLPPLLPASGMWPPNNVKSFFHWLGLVDPASAKKLSQVLGTKAGARNPILIVLEHHSGVVAVQITIPENIAKSTDFPSRFRKQLLIDKGNLGTRFVRIRLDDYSPRFLTSRNLASKSLESKRIVLIGCGTIGGYLARLLVQVGAGLGIGELVLYDGQALSVGNIGRHYLDGKYLYDNKADACCHKLQKEYPSSTISSAKSDFVSLKSAKKADLVIDATGREAFSLMLNAQALDLKNTRNACPDILYAWIDGNGCCGRTFHFDGTSACYRCLRTPSGEDRFPPLKSSDDLVPMQYQCSDSYVPFPPSASTQAAAIALEAVLGWAEGNTNPTFRTRGFTQSARKHKNQNIDAMTGCPACQS